jgi:hypothetical protein
VGVWIGAATAHSTFVPWAVAASVLSLITATGVYMCFAALNDWPPIRNRKWSRSRDWASDSAVPTAEDLRDFPARPIRELGKGLGALIPARPGPLEIKLEDEDWDLWQGTIWIAALKIRITNTSTDRAIRIKNFRLESYPAISKMPKPTTDHGPNLIRDIRERSESHGSRLSAMALYAGDSISGWYVRWAALPTQGGRPRCTFIVTDAAGDTYELDIPARPQKTHRMPSYYEPQEPESEFPAEDFPV